MQPTGIIRILGLLLMLMSVIFIPPLWIEFGYHDGQLRPFYVSFFLTFIIGFIAWFPLRKKIYPLRTHHGFLIVAMFWITSGLVGALPLYFSMLPKITFTDAFFESVSGLTTTGATIFKSIDSLPHSILYYRQQLQFLGGISIIILAVDIWPTLGIGGMQLFRTEITGPVKDDKLTPRVTQTAKAIWLVYVIMTILCLICYRIAGMTWFDAVGHSFSTVSTGGFSTHDANFEFFHSKWIEGIAIVFMLLGAINFSLHYLAFKRQDLKLYWQDPELRMYIKLLFNIVILTWIVLIILSPSQFPHQSMMDGIFQTVSLATTTGFSTVDYSYWPPFIPIMLLFAAMIGGCSGSTSGGVKAIRVLLLQKQGTREIHRLIHPHGQLTVKLGGKALSPKVIEAVWGFFAIYAVVFTFLLLLLLLANEDFLTLYSALIACISNAGRGLGHVSQHFSGLSDYAKWVLTIAMLAGRLEIFTLLVIFSPVFWRR